MRDFSKFSNPTHNPNFLRWTGHASPPPSKEELRLAQLRHQLGNIAGTRQHVRELHGHKADALLAGWR